jgi:hypothetical protein
MSSSRYTAVHALGTVAVVLALVLGVTSLGHDARANAQARAVRAIAARTGVPAASLRASVRSELETDRHWMVRVRGVDGSERTVAVASGSTEVLVSGEAGTLARLTRDEHAATRLGQLGGFRVASWIGVLGDGTCDVPVGPKDVKWRRVDDGGAELRFAFLRVDAGHARRAECVVRLGADGVPLEVRVDGPERSTRSGTSISLLAAPKSSRS